LKVLKTVTIERYNRANDAGILDAGLNLLRMTRGIVGDLLVEVGFAIAPERGLRSILDEGPIEPGDRKYRVLLNDLQGNILKSHGREHAALLFLSFRDNSHAALRNALSDHVAPKVTSAAKQISDAERRGATGYDAGGFTNFMLTASGYRAISERLGNTGSSTAFLNGMKASRTLLDPLVAEWEKPYQRDIHALVIVADDQRERAKAAVRELLTELDHVVSEHHVEWGAVIRDSKGEPIEHFGYRDGISQPLFLRGDFEKARSEGIDNFNPGARLRLVLTQDPNGRYRQSYGSYFVFRKLEQDVRAFHDAENRLATALGIGPELAGAYIIGRFRDGTPVVVSEKPDAEAPVNNFNFRVDPRGGKCPLHAHIRKIGPRSDDLPTRAHRMARRGVPYGGGPFEDPDSYPATGAGLLFMAFNVEIGGLSRYERQGQFGFVQAFWANNPNFLTKGTGIDPIIGHGAAADLPRSWPIEWGGALTELNELHIGKFVTMKGGEYFFAPSISFIYDLRLGSFEDTAEHRHRPKTTPSRRQTRF
jgi:Dyp-type peroxidase family